MPDDGTRRCVLCGGYVSTRNGPGRRSEYCSAECREESRRRRQRSTRAQRSATTRSVPAPRRPDDPRCQVGLLRTTCGGTPTTYVIIDGRRRLACQRCRFFVERIGRCAEARPAATVGPPPRHAAAPGPQSQQSSAYVGKHFDPLVVKVDGFVISALNRMSLQDVLESQFVAELRSRIRSRSTPVGKSSRKGVSRIVLVIHGRHRLRPWVARILTEHLGGYRLDQITAWPRRHL